jgi:hypothetical protein
MELLLPVAGEVQRYDHRLTDHDDAVELIILLPP